MSDQVDQSIVEPYLVRLLDECREEIRICDSKASILFAGVALAIAFLSDQLVDATSMLRTNGLAAEIFGSIAVVALGSSMWMLGLAVLPRLGAREPGQARYFEEQAQFADHTTLLTAVTEAAHLRVDRHAQQLLTLARIARRKYQHLRHAMYSVCIAMAALTIAAVISAVR
jgi:hypothetical protein